MLLILHEILLPKKMYTTCITTYTSKPNFGLYNCFVAVAVAGVVLVHSVFFLGSYTIHSRCFTM